MIIYFKHQKAHRLNTCQTTGQKADLFVTDVPVSSTETRYMYKSPTSDKNNYLICSEMKTKVKEIINIEL